MHVKGESSDADSLGIAKVLAAAIKSVPHDVVFLGKQGVGTDNGLVGPMVAELLGYPQVNVVTHLEVGDGKLTAHREIEGAEEVLEAPMPAIVTAQKGLNEPRYASLKGIMAAKKIAIDTKSRRRPRPRRRRHLQAARRRRVAGAAARRRAAAARSTARIPTAAAQEILKYIKEEAKAL